MKKTSSLKFGEGGRSLSIIFDDGSKSIPLHSKEEALPFLVKMVNLKKIEDEKFKEMQSKIIAAPNLPWTIKGKDKNPVTVEMVSQDLNNLLESLDLSGVYGLLVVREEIFQPSEKISFLPCGCEVRRGIISTRGGLTTFIYDTETAENFLNVLLKLEEIVQSEKEEVSRQIFVFFS